MTSINHTKIKKLAIFAIVLALYLGITAVLTSQLITKVFEVVSVKSQPVLTGVLVFIIPAVYAIVYLFAARLVYDPTEHAYKMDVKFFKIAFVFAAVSVIPYTMEAAYLNSQASAIAHVQILFMFFAGYVFIMTIGRFLKFAWKVLA